MLCLTRFYILLLCFHVSFGSFGKHKRVAIACEHSKPGSATCPPGHVIKIVRGFYGRDDKTTCGGGRNTNCFARGSEQKLRHHCQDRSSCVLDATNRVFGDPCHGIRKYVKLIYTCVKQQPQCRRPNEPDNGSIRPPRGDLFNPGQKIWFACDRGFDLVGHKDFRCQDDGNWSPREFPRCYRVAIACEHKPRGSATCPPGHVIKIVRGFYGRDDTTTCRGGNVENTNCFAEGSEQKLRHLCQDKTSCDLEASSCAFGDPCYGIRKYIKLIYYCKKH